MQPLSALRAKPVVWLFLGLGIVAVASALLTLRLDADVGERWIGNTDQSDITVLARNLVEGHGPMVDFVWIHTGGGLPGNRVRQPEPYWSLCHAAIIAPFVYVFGANRPMLLFVALLMKMGIAALGCYWILRLTRSHLACFAGGVFLLVHPSIVDTVNGLFDIFWSFFAFLAGTLFLRGWERRSRVWMLAGGVAAGITVAIKPTGLFLVGCYLVFLLLPRPSLTRLNASWIVLLGVVMGAAPWALHNLGTHDSLLPAGYPYVRQAAKIRTVTGNHNRAFYDPRPLSSEERAQGNPPRARWAQVGVFLQLLWADEIWPLWLLALAFLGALLLLRTREPPEARLFAGFGALTVGVGLLYPWLAPDMIMYPRYWSFALPALCVLAASAVSVLPFARVALSVGSAWLLWVGLPYHLTVRDLDPKPMPAGYATVRELLPEDAVVYSSMPWDVTFYTRRLGVALPYTDDEAIIEHVARRYGVQYLVIVDKDARHPYYDAIESGRFPPWVEKIHHSENLVVGRVRFDSGPR